MNITQSELAKEDIVFNNANNLDAESFEIELAQVNNSWGDNFHLWINGQLTATFRSFNGLVRRADAIITANHLERVA